MRTNVFKALSVLPAIGVFLFLTGASQAGDGSASEPPKEPPTTATWRDAWDVPTTDHGVPPPELKAWGRLSARSMPKPEAEFRKDEQARQQMPATKAPAAVYFEKYDDYARSIAGMNRLRLTRFWFTPSSERLVESSLQSVIVPMVERCTGHTWAFGRELTLTFELTEKLEPESVSTDGPPALTECFLNRLSEAFSEKSTRARLKSPKPLRGKFIASFVVMKP